MTRIDIIELLLDNPELIDKHNYSKKDINQIDLSKENVNEFISFIMTIVNIVEDNPGNEKVQVKKIFNVLNIT